MKTPAILSSLLSIMGLGPSSFPPMLDRPQPATVAAPSGILMRMIPGSRSNSWIAPAKNQRKIRRARRRANAAGRRNAFA